MENWPSLLVSESESECPTPNGANVCLSTGAGSGIGRAVCKILARDGARVIAADKNLESALETITDLGSGRFLMFIRCALDFQQVTDKSKVSNVFLALHLILSVCNNFFEYLTRDVWQLSNCFELK